MVDGLHFHEDVALTVPAFYESGQRPLGLREDTTENQTVCRELLASVVGRDLPADRTIPVVIDGGKGLHKVVRMSSGCSPWCNEST